MEIRDSLFSGVEIERDVRNPKSITAQVRAFLSIVRPGEAFILPSDIPIGRVENAAYMSGMQISRKKQPNGLYKVWRIR